MLIDAPYIKLTVEKETDMIPKMFYRAVVGVFDKGILRSIDKYNEDEKTPKRVKLIKKRSGDVIEYYLPVVRLPSAAEITKIFRQLQQEYEYDLQLETSEEDGACCTTEDIDYTSDIDKMYQNAFVEASTYLGKQIHDRLYKQRSNQGWRFSTSYDEDNKTDPLHKPWEQLTEKQRMDWQEELEAVLGIFEQNGLVLAHEEE